MARTGYKIPLLFCFIGPGASGKSTICNALVEDSNLPLQLSISSTTREARSYEKEGREYFFLTKEEFSSRRESGDFLEFAEFAGNFYGTEKRNLDSAIENKKHLLLDIEIEGVTNLRKMYPDQVVVTFICPPSLEKLRERFKARGSDSEERIEERIVLAREEIKMALSDGFADYIIINDSLGQSMLHAKGLILGELVKRKRVDPAFIRKIQSE